MKNHGVADEHTNIPGIWKKLHTLYNLEGLDEREDMPDDETDDSGSSDPGWAGFQPFQLPEDEFGELMRARRIDPNSTDSPLHSSMNRNLVLRGPRSGRSGSVSTTRTGADEEEEQDDDETVDGKSSGIIVMLGGKLISYY